MPDHGNGAVRLTPRQIDIIKAIADDLSYKQIADRFGISPKTVEFHIMRIKETLDGKGTVGIVRYAIRAGLIEP